MSFFQDINYDGPQTSGKSTYKKAYTIQEGQENIFRIAPSCRSLAPGFYGFYERIHFGYGVQDTQNPDKIRARPFKCIHKVNYKTKEIDVACDECLKIEQVKNEMEALKVQLAKDGHPQDYIRQATTPQFDWLRQHNLDSKWLCYAKNLSGEWNILKLGHKAKLALDVVMKRLQSEDGIRALAPNSGVWFRFTKNGLKGSNAATTVEVLREKVEMNGQKVEVIKAAPLTAADEQAINALPDITNSSTVLTSEQIASLVKSGGDPEVAATIFSLGQKKEQPQTQQPVTSIVMSATPGALPKATQAHQQQLPAKTSVTPSPSDVLDMTPDAFLRRFANGGK